MIIKKAANRIRAELFPTEHTKMFRKWCADGGDDKFRFDYDLNENSFVIDLGGYCGQWASDIFSRYLCNVSVFEPVSEFAKKIETRFSRNSKIQVYQFGLGGSTREESISVCGTSSSIYRNSSEKETTKIVDVRDWFSSNKVEAVDLIKINIEGGEYELLERLIETDLISKILDLQVQFHHIASDSETRMQTIQEALKNTHYLTYQYKFVWENWTRRDYESVTR